MWPAVLTRGRDLGGTRAVHDECVPLVFGHAAHLTRGYSARSTGWSHRTSNGDEPERAGRPWLCPIALIATAGRRGALLSGAGPRACGRAPAPAGRREPWRPCARVAGRADAG